MDKKAEKNRKQEPTMPDPRLINELKEAVSLMKTTLERQTTALAAQTNKINIIYEKLFGISTVDVFDFPIKTMEELEGLDKRLQLEPNFEVDVKLLLGNKLRGKVSSNLSAIIVDNLLTGLNWNGRKNMKRLSGYKFFQVTLYASVSRFYFSYDDYERDMKDAIKKGKNRLDQRNHKLRLQNKMIL